MLFFFFLVGGSEYIINKREKNCFNVPTALGRGWKEEKEVTVGILRSPVEESSGTRWCSIKSTLDKVARFYSDYVSRNRQKIQFFIVGFDNT